MNNSSETDGVNHSQDRPNPAKNQGVTKREDVTSEDQLTAYGVPDDDNPYSINGHSSDKLNDKLENEAKKEPELIKVIEAWPELPGPIQSAILALVRASGSQTEA